MLIKKILHLQKSQIRVFPFQTKDHAFILYPDLPSSYLLNLLIDGIGMDISQFTFDYVYPTQTYYHKTLKNLGTYKEDYFIFYLENYFHSSDFAFGFLEKCLEKMKENQQETKVIIHTIKTPKDDLKKVMERFNNVYLIVNGDFEEFFYELFIKKIPIENITNIFYRDDREQIYVNENQPVVSDLNNYIGPAYVSGYYSFFPKVKDEIISLIDEDNKYTDESIYYRQSKETFVNAFRYRPETSIMLTTGRGCKYKCSYCYRGAKYASVRRISLETLKKDLDYLEEHGYENIYFYDDCFITTNGERLDELVLILKKYSFRYQIAARYEVCTSERLLQLSQANIVGVQIGLQSISLETNKEAKRGFKMKQFEDTIKKMKDLGMQLSLDIILGLPGEGVKGFIKTFNYAVSLSPESIFINSLFLNPGTDLYEKQEEYGIKTYNSRNKRELFHVESIKSSNGFTEQDIIFARKYVSFYIKKLNHINIILR